MKELFENYYKRLTKYYQEKFNSKPTICYLKEYDKKLVISEEDEDGYVEWQPVYLTQKVDFTKLEQKIGFEICKDLKDFYSTCLLGELSGKLDKQELMFSCITNRKKIISSVEQYYKDGQWLFPDSQIFLIGDAVVDGNDNWFICFDNLKKALFIYNNEEEQQKKIKLPSITSIISKLDLL